MIACKFCGREFKRERDLGMHLGWCKRNPERLREAIVEEKIAERGPIILASVSMIPINPRIVYASNAVLEALPVLVADSGKLWVGCPMRLRVSPGNPGFYEMLDPLPRGRWDKGYAERVQREGSASGTAVAS